MKRFFPLVLTGWIIFLILYLSHIQINISDTKEVRAEFLYYILFVIYNTFLLIYTRAFVNDSYWFLLLLLPCALLCFLNLLFFNKPMYHGAMEGFAMLSDFYIMIKILITYPAFVFAFSITKSNQKIKSIGILLFVVITGVSGVMQSIGYEGYLADSTGRFFVVMLFMLADTGVYYLIKKRNTTLYTPTQ